MQQKKGQMAPLKGAQRKYLRGLAHSLKPVVIVGQHGLTDALITAVDAALRSHELIKIKFNEYKEKTAKTGIMTEIESRTNSHRVGMIGHVAILYRPHPEPDRRVIRLPA